MIIHKPHLLTKLDIWTPRYKDKIADGSWVILPACYKVQDASPVIIFTFSKAKHLAGVRKCITREKAMSYPVQSNGKIPCYAIPYDNLETWETAEELRDLAFSLFDN